MIARDLRTMLANLLSEKYALPNAVLTPAPRGFIAKTYYIAAGSMRYFAKIVARPADADAMVQSLPVLQMLRQSGMNNIPVPIPTVDGNLSVAFDGKTLALFNHVTGQHAYDFPLAPYVRLLAQVHAFSEPIPPSLARETFTIAFKNDLLQLLQRVWTGEFDNPHQYALQAWAAARRYGIERDITILDETAQQLQTTDMAFTLTHGDAPGNVLVDGDQITLVDWDTVMLAPSERDTWFHRHNEVFLKLYRTLVPGYDFNRVACRYYLYNRYFEDLLGFIEKILATDIPDAEKEKHFRDLVETCDEWLGPLMNDDRDG